MMVFKQQCFNFKFIVLNAAEINVHFLLHAFCFFFLPRDPLSSQTIYCCIITALLYRLFFSHNKKYHKKYFSGQSKEKSCCDGFSFCCHIWHLFSTISHLLSMVLFPVSIYETAFILLLFNSFLPHSLNECIQ